MPQPDAPTSLMVGNEEAVGLCGLRVSWHCLHDKCSHEMSIVDQAQSLLHGSKVLLNEQKGWHLSNGNATLARLLRTYWAKVSHYLSGRLQISLGRRLGHQGEVCLLNEK
uniref:Uncharacterized protein n=1 Tax=Ursus maritimus TaxID=29073 RepID=A0A452T9E7_URSMA